MIVASEDKITTLQERCSNLLLLTNIKHILGFSPPDFLLPVIPAFHHRSKSENIKMMTSALTQHRDEANDATQLTKGIILQKDSFNISRKQTHTDC